MTEKAEASSQSTPFLVTATEGSTARTTDPHPTHDWLESAERDYAFSDYEFFGREWGEILLNEVKRLRRDTQK